MRPFPRWHTPEEVAQQLIEGLRSGTLATNDEIVGPLADPAKRWFAFLRLLTLRFFLAWAATVICLFALIAFESLGEFDLSQTQLVTAAVIMFSFFLLMATLGGFFRSAIGARPIPTRSPRNSSETASEVPPSIQRAKKHSEIGPGLGYASMLVTALICALVPMVVALVLVQFTSGDAAFSGELWGFKLAGSQRPAAFVIVYVLSLFGILLLLRALRPTQSDGD